MTNPSLSARGTMASRQKRKVQACLLASPLRVCKLAFDYLAFRTAPYHFAELVARCVRD